MNHETQIANVRYWIDDLVKAANRLADEKSYEAEQNYLTASQQAEDACGTLRVALMSERYDIIQRRALRAAKAKRNEQKGETTTIN